MDSTILDTVDRAILYHLQKDARMQITDVADAVGVSDNTVRNRIRALEEAGVIEGYHVDINYDAAGVQHHYLFVCTARVSEREHLAAAAREHTDVVEVITLMTGQENILILGVAFEKDDITELAYDLDDIGLIIEHEQLIRNHRRKSYDRFRLDDA